MPTVTGNITDVGLTPMAGIGLYLKFVLSGPATRDGGLVSSNPKYVTPGSDGSYTATLIRTTNLRPADGRSTEVVINVFAVWLDPNDPAGTGRDQFLAALRVPAAGGNIADLMDAPPPPGFMSWGFGPPTQNYAAYWDISGALPILWLNGAPA